MKYSVIDKIIGEEFFGKEIEFVLDRIENMYKGNAEFYQADGDIVIEFKKKPNTVVLDLVKYDALVKENEDLSNRLFQSHERVRKLISLPFYKAKVPVEIIEKIENGDVLKAEITVNDNVMYPNTVLVAHLFTISKEEFK